LSKEKQTDEKNLRWKTNQLRRRKQEKYRNRWNILEHSMLESVFFGSICWWTKFLLKTFMQFVVAIRMFFNVLQDRWNLRNIVRFCKQKGPVYAGVFTHKLLSHKLVALHEQLRGLVFDRVLQRFERPCKKNKGHSSNCFYSRSFVSKNRYYGSSGWNFIQNY